MTTTTHLASETSTNTISTEKILAISTEKILANTSDFRFKTTTDEISKNNSTYSDILDNRTFFQLNIIGIIIVLIILLSIIIFCIKRRVKNNIAKNYQCEFNAGNRLTLLHLTSEDNKNTQKI